MKKTIVFQASIILLSVFLLACLWEFFLEGIWAQEKIGESDFESMREKWEYVFTSLVFSFIALLYPMFKVYQAFIELKDLNTSLEKKVDERTHELNMQKEELEMAYRAKSDFLSRMSHELRTPMNSILGFAQLLRIGSFGKLTAHQNENLDMILSSGDHLLKLINNVLDLSKYESGDMTLTLERVDIIPIVEKAIEESKDLAENSEVIIKCKKVENDCCFLRVDSMIFSKVVTNLLSNAIKYSVPNGTVEISLEKLNSGLLRIGFKDNGKGVPLEKRESLFLPFEVMDEEFGKGLGVGLALSKIFVEMMNGRIGFEDNPEGGSFFYIDLPIADKAIVSNY